MQIELDTSQIQEAKDSGDALVDELFMLNEAIRNYESCLGDNSKLQHWSECIIYRITEIDYWCCTDLVDKHCDTYESLDDLKDIANNILKYFLNLLKLNFNDQNLCENEDGSDASESPHNDNDVGIDDHTLIPTFTWKGNVVTYKFRNKGDEEIAPDPNTVNFNYGIGKYYSDIKDNSSNPNDVEISPLDPYAPDGSKLASFVVKNTSQQIMSRKHLPDLVSDGDSFILRSNIGGDYEGFSMSPNIGNHLGVVSSLCGSYKPLPFVQKDVLIESTAESKFAAELWADHIGRVIPSNNNDTNIP